jgi:hypothetical protein
MLNTLVSVSAAMCMVELYFRQPEHPGRWIALSGALVGASLLTKGPAGIPDYMGTWIWAAIVASKAREWRWWRSSATWLPLAIGLALFMAWVAWGWMWIRAHGVVIDWMGLREGGTVLYPGGAGDPTPALIIVPVLFAMAIPPSLTLLSLFVTEVRQNPADPLHEKTIKALAATVLCAWLLCMITGTGNPRHAYGTLPLLAPVAGAMVAAYPRLPAKHKRTFIGWPIGTAVGLVAAHIGFTKAAWPAGQWHQLMLATAVVSGVLCLLVLVQVGIRRRWNWSGVIIAQLLLLSIPFATRLNDEHRRKSGYTVATQLKAVVGNQRIYAGEAIFDQPEIFLYSGADGYTKTETLPPPEEVDGNQWVLLKLAEFAAWDVEHNPRLTKKTYMGREPGKPEYLVAWLLPMPGAE